MTRQRYTRVFVFSTLIVCATSFVVIFRSNIEPPRHTPPETGTESQSSSTPVDLMLRIPDEPTPILPKPVSYTFIEITDSCGPAYGEECARAYATTSTSSPSVLTLRTGMVLRVGGIVRAGNRTWYKIMFDEWIRYPERLTGDLYVPDTHANKFEHVGVERIASTSTSRSKRIVVDISEQTLRAYDADTLFMSATTSTGIKSTPTPMGTFTIFQKTPSRYMQGPLPGISDKEYDLPGVPWNLYFTEEGAVIHGAYWHDAFGRVWSNGCVNLSPSDARTLYEWADVGTIVTVQE